GIFRFCRCSCSWDIRAFSAIEHEQEQEQEQDLPVTAVCDPPRSNRCRRSQSATTVLRKIHGEIDRCDHTVGTGNSLAGNFKCGAVIGTGSRKRKAKRYVHTLVKGVKFQRDQSLIVIHAEYRIELIFNHMVKDGVGGVVTGEKGMKMDRSGEREMQLV